MKQNKTAFTQRCEALAHNEDACRETYNNQYHKVRADVVFDDWRSVWRLIKRLGCHWPPQRKSNEDMHP